ncbi:hypothetical protein AVEN_27517-1 [Araneus ventricosus]|uniref:Uncharacterized protein n=1 Tax=Araneus ventricosus TaxID=182803 RepID=A0A4Y2WIG6_ARAVE|nr:hypothetical protein AVEN_26099-1 [Araneus ventricosus]GBO37010.1 hypothetical protein AVEN_27517-1 [Araneus ventricosus]
MGKPFLGMEIRRINIRRFTNDLGRVLGTYHRSSEIGSNSVSAFLHVSCGRNESSPHPSRTTDSRFLALRVYEDFSISRALDSRFLVLGV